MYPNKRIRGVLSHRKPNIELESVRLGSWSVIALAAVFLVLVLKKINGRKKMIKHINERIIFGCQRKESIYFFLPHLRRVRMKFSEPALQGRI